MKYQKMVWDLIAEYKGNDTEPMDGDEVEIKILSTELLTNK